MFLANLSPRERLLFYVTVGVVCVSLSFNFVLRPLGRKWSQLNRQILDREIKLKRNIRYLEQKDAVERIYQDYSRYARQTGADEEEVTVLLNEVEKVARAAGIHIANIRPRPIKEFGFYKKYILEMNCEATMENYLEFIYNLQKSAQLIRVERLRLTSRSKHSSLLQARMYISKVLTTE